MIDRPVENEAELQARLESRIRAALPLLPAQIRLERHLHLQLGHHNVIIDGIKSERESVRGRYDVLVLLNDKPLLLAELKDPEVILTEAEIGQALSYARVHTPIVPLVLVTNGQTTILRRTYDGAQLDASDVQADRLQSVLISVTALAASDAENAIRTLLGTSRETWTHVLSTWTDQTIGALTGNVRDFGCPVAREFVVPRRARTIIEDHLTAGKKVVVLHGPPISGVTNVLAQFSRGRTVGPTLFCASQATPDILLYMANRLTRELNFGVSKDDVRAWFNTGRGLLDITLVLDGLPVDGIEELVENASAGLFRLVIGMSSDAYTKAATVEGRAQRTLLGRTATDVVLEPLSDEEFNDACVVLGESFGATFFNGAQHRHNLRWPRALRSIAAVLPGGPCPSPDDSGRTTLSMIPPFTEPLDLPGYSEIFTPDPSIRFELQKLAAVYLADVDRHGSDPDWMVATWGKPSLDPRDLEIALGQKRVDRLCELGFLSWGDSPELGPRFIVRFEELLLHHVAEEWATTLVKAAGHNALPAEIDRLLELTMRIPGGEIALAAAIIRSSKKSQQILGMAVPMLIEKRPTTSRLKEGAKVEVLLKDCRIRLHFGKGMDEEVVGDIHPWMVLSHLALHPMLADGETFTVNASIFSKLGTWPHLLYCPQPSELARVPGFHFHDIPGIGSLPCLTTGIVEPLMQAMLNHMHAFPHEMEALSKNAMSEKEPHLAWRVLTVAITAETSTDEQVQQAAMAIQAALRPWWGKALTAALKKHVPDDAPNGANEVR